MKQKGLIVTATIFFLIVNTSYFWEKKLGMLGFPAFILLVLLYAIFVFVLLWQFRLIIKEKFVNRSRLLASGFLTLILLVIFLKPDGIVNFGKFDGNDLVVAQREGTANCFTSLSLKDNHKFIETTTCFGMTEIKGNYERKGDTIFFKNIELGRDAKEYYQFAVIQPPSFSSNNILTDLIEYKDYNDTVGYRLLITKNILSKY